MADDKVGLIRHALATVAYRGAKAGRGVAAEFPDFVASRGTRKPVEILAHVGGLISFV